MKTRIIILLIFAAALIVWAQTGTPHGNHVSATAVSGATGYNVYRCSGAACSNFTLITPTALAAPDFLDPAAGLIVGNSYSYVMTALQNGNESAFSNTATIVDTTFPVNPPPPAGCNVKQQ
jgi:hypothetical protein